VGLRKLRVKHDPPTTSTTNEKKSSESHTTRGVYRVVGGLQQFTTPTTNGYHPPKRQANFSPPTN